MLQPTVSPHCLTASTAAAVVACSRTMRSFGNLAWSLCRCCRKDASALRIVMFCRQVVAHSDSAISSKEVGHVKQAHLFFVARHLAMQVQHQPLPLHLCKHFIIDVVALDATV